MRPTHEPTTPGNPKDFAIDQHVFPKSAIARFANGNGRVQTQGMFGVPRMRAPSEKIFCAQRAWDHSAETYRTIGYEEPYRKLADAIVSGKVERLSAEQDDIATLFIALWNARHHARHSPTGDIAMNGVTPMMLTKEQEENLEKKGVMFARGTSMPSRFMTGMRMVRSIDFEYDQYRGKHWGIIRSTKAQFLVPDNVTGFRWIPVAPHIGLSPDSDDVTISDEQVAEVNRISLKCVKEYYFGLNLANCPR